MEKSKNGTETPYHAPDGQSKSKATMLLDLKDTMARLSLDLCHKQAQHSLLSHHNKKIEVRGLLNLLVIIVVVQNARLILENFIKYGVRIKFYMLPTSFQDLVGNWPVPFSLIWMQVFFCIAFYIERYVMPFVYSHRIWGSIETAYACMLANAFMVLYVPYSTVRLYKVEPVIATILLCFSITWFLKLMSFHQILADVRYSALNLDSINDFKIKCIVEKYPKVVSLKHFYSFLPMPTMCFQFEYPRKNKTSWVAVFRHLIELLGCVLLITVIVQQYMDVLLQNTFNPSTNKRSKIIYIAHLFERILKLSIPSLMVWLLAFLALFHHWLNILGEVTRFSDCHFYGDWWNSSSFGEYWRKWNLPIHNFVSVHVYRPLLRRKVPKMLAGQFVFLMSAFAHEYLVCVPLQIKFNGLIFCTFLLQVPLMHLTSTQRFQKHQTLGNVIFWILFCFTGQPLITVVYYYIWGTTNNIIPRSGWVNELFSF